MIKHISYINMNSELYVQPLDYLLKCINLEDTRVFGFRFMKQQEELATLREENESYRTKLEDSNCQAWEQKYKSWETKVDICQKSSSFILCPLKQPISDVLLEYMLGKGSRNATDEVARPSS